MPSFGRLGKHSNRSSQALASSKTPATTTTPSATSGSAATGAPAATTQATGHQRQPSHQQQQQQQLLDEADSAAHSAHSGHGFGHSHNASANASNPANSSATPHSALSSSHNTAYSSSESFDSRQPSHLLQQQHQHQGQQPLHLQHPQQQHQPQTPLLPSPSSASAGGAPPPPHLYSSPSAASSTTGANINNPPSLQQQQSSNLSGYDGHQSHSDFVDPGLGRSQSIRYSSATPYDIATSSVDDLNSHAAGYGQAPPPAQQLQPPPPPQQQQQPQATPQKLSTRKLIKGIFSGSNRGASDSSQHHHGISIGHGHHHSYDNTGGLARRPSKRHRVQTRSNPLFPLQPNSPKPNQPQLVNPGYYWRQPPSHPLPPPAQAEQIQQVQQVPDNPQSPYPPQLSSRQGLDDINEHYSAHESNSHSPSQNSRISLHNTIRQVSGEVDQQQHSANYEDVAYRQNQAPPQQQQQPPQPHVQVHPQDQQSQTIYETSVYDQQPSPLNPPQHPSSQQPYPYSNSQQPGYHQGGIQGGDLRTVPAHLGTVSQFQNPETVSQFSHESPITDSDQRSANLQSASTSPAVNHSVYIQNHGSTTSLPPAQQITPQPQQSGMAPPAGGPPPSRRPEADKLRGQVDPPAGPPPTYRHSTSMNNMNPLPPVPQGAGQPQPYQGNRPPQFEGDQGRDSPQPVSAVPADPAGDDKSFKDLLTKYKNVKRLYFDGKAQIDALTGQIVHLQNAVANQRMSQSRTALDDNEYSTRWNRLNGAINNLSFNIRKDWRSVPQWLVSYVSADALKTGKAEMTAVGRAVISRWLMEEVFNKCFHPGLDPQLSQSLKEIELNIRHNAYTMTSQEEFDALTNKVVNWRMTTLEGLHRQLNSPSTADNRTAFTAKATSTLTACLYQFLNNPPPAGVEGSTSMIVELAVGIAANLPLESRDVAITYPLPGEIVQPRVMEVEKAPLPPLEDQKDDGEDDDKKKEEGDDKSGKAKTVAVPSDANRVRFAGFMALEVRGRQVLWKAPIWTL